MAGNDGVVEATRQSRQTSGKHQTNAHGMTMRDREVLDALDRVAERVTVVQRLAEAGFTKIGTDYLRLHGDGSLDELASVRPVGPARAVDVLLDEVEDCRV